jgi:hypothetical protein
MGSSAGRRKIAKLIVTLCAIGYLASFAFGGSFYFRNLPRDPQPELGRIYPLNNHGVLLYMTEREELQQNRSFILSGVLFAVGFLIDCIFDVSERRAWERFRRMHRPPWNHRWGTE